MKTLKLYLISTLAFISIASCKKNNVEVITDPEKAVEYKDSISFKINEKQYVFNTTTSYGNGNQQINIKPSPIAIKGRRPAYETGGYYFYGEIDSTLYSVHYELRSEQLTDNFNINFTKKFENSQLNQGLLLLAPTDHLGIFKTGKLSFAVDLEKENTMDGVAIDFKGSGIPEQLSTCIPGFSILVRSSLTKDIQNNSNFEITKVKNLNDGLYLIEAKFAVNLYGESEKLYKLENGFLRMKVHMNPWVL